MIVSKALINTWVKLKGRSGMKQNIKSKPMKWSFKFWIRFSSKSGYLYQMDIY